MSSRISSSRISRLPSRFPLGTRYIIEGRGGLIHLRYLEFPDGGQIALPADLAERRSAGARRRHEPQKHGPKKFSSSEGTAKRVGR
jgi:hypothetical protein